jgi:2'-5' RNA ligase
LAEPTEAAVIIPIPSAERIVAEHRRELDPAASLGVPAHVTVLYPFVPPRKLDGEVVSRLSAVVRSADPFECTFSRCDWFGEDVLWLAPDPDRPFRDLTMAVANEFPDYPPYGGAFDDPVPHLTVGEVKGGTADQLRAAEAAVTPKLPIVVRIEHALLIAGSREPGSWRTVLTLPLGDRTA